MRDPSEETGGRDGRTRSVALAALGILALLVVVSLASRAHHGAAGGGSGTGPSRAFYDYVATTAFLLFGIGGALVVWVFVVSGGGYRRKGPRKGNSLTILAGATVVSLAFALTMRFHGFLGHLLLNRRRVTPQVPAIPNAAGTGLKGGHQAYNPHFQWIPAAILGLLVLGALAMIAVRLLRRREELLREVGIAEALATVVDDALDDLRAERDPRRAIIAAYARMERLCAAHGVTRHEAETPFEYVGRVLSLLSVERLPTLRLTELFERAKFSRHRLGLEARTDAIDALERVRDALRAPA